MTLERHRDPSLTVAGGPASWWSRRRPRDATAALTVVLFAALLIPSPLIFAPLGAAGTPANVIALGLLLWWALATIGTRQRPTRREQPLHAAFVVILAVVMASIVTLVARPLAPQELTGAIRGVLFLGSIGGVALVAADGVISVARVHTLIRRLVHGVAIVSILGIIEFASGFNPAQALSIPGLSRNLVLPDQQRLLFLRVQSTALHPIELGSVLGLTLPLAIHLAMTGRTRRRRVIAGIEVALIGIVLPMTLSRTGIIAAMIGMTVLALDWSWRRRIGVVVGAVALLGAIRIAIPGLVAGLIDIFVNVGNDESTTGRTSRYDTAGAYILEHPWFGRGYNTLQPATGQIFDNQYLYVATEIGVVGLVVVLGLFLLLISLSITVRRQATDVETRSLARALTGIFLAVMVIFGTADMMSFSMAMLIILLLAGCTGALWRLTSTDARAVAPNDDPDSFVQARVRSQSARPRRIPDSS